MWADRTTSTRSMRAGKLDPLLNGRGTSGMSQGATFTVGLIQMRSGLEPHANLDAAARLIDEAKAGGADYVQTPEMTNILALKREQLFAAIVAGGARPEPRGVPRAGAQARHLSSCRLARDQAFARQGRQPLVPDRPAGRDRRALRQDPHVRRRSGERRELPRIAQLPPGRTRRGRRPAVGPARPDRSATTCASRRSTGRWRRRAPPSSPSRRPSPGRPARRTGTC